MTPKPRIQWSAPLMQNEGTVPQEGPFENQLEVDSADQQPTKREPPEKWEDENGEFEEAAEGNEFELLGQFGQPDPPGLSSPSHRSTVEKDPRGAHSPSKRADGLYELNDLFPRVHAICLRDFGRSSDHKVGSTDDQHPSDSHDSLSGGITVEENAPSEGGPEPGEGAFSQFLNNWYSLCGSAHHHISANDFALRTLSIIRMSSILLPPSCC